MAYRFNPFTGTLDYYQAGGGSSGIAIDGTSITTAIIPFEFGLSIPSTDSFGASIILDQDDLSTRSLSFELASNRVTLTNPEVGGKTKIHGQNRVEITTATKAFTLFESATSLFSFDIDFQGNVIFDNDITCSGDILLANTMMLQLGSDPNCYIKGDTGVGGIEISAQGGAGYEQIYLRSDSLTEINSANAVRLTGDAGNYTLEVSPTGIIATCFGGQPFQISGNLKLDSFFPGNSLAYVDSSKIVSPVTVSSPLSFSSGTLSLPTSSTPTFAGLTIGLGAAGTDYQINFDGETFDGYLKWLEDEGTLALATRGASEYWYAKGDPGEYTSAYVVSDINNVNAVGRTAFQAWIRQVTNSGSASELAGFWGGVYDDGSSCQNLGTATSLYAYNSFFGTNARTISLSQNLVTGTEIGASCTVTIARGVVAQAVSSQDGTGVTTTNEAIRVKETNGTPTTNYGIFFERMTAGATTNAEAIFQTAGICAFRAVGQKVYSSAANTIDIDTTTTGNLRVGGTTEYTWNATTFTFADANNIAVGTGAGTIIATATNQKLGFYNATPITQRSGAAQAAVATTGATNIAPFGYTTAAQADAIVTLVNELRAWAVAQGFIKGSA